MAYVDVHAHLDFKDFDQDREELIKKLKENNIITLSNTLNPENYERTKLLFKEAPHVHVCPGLYPQDSEKISDQEFESYISYLRAHKKDFVAIGEVGLDRYNTIDPQLWELQEKRFKALIELGIELDKPVIMHTRKAEERVIEILEHYVQETGFKKFDLHCFSGKKKLIPRIKALGIFCSIPLIVLNTQSFQLLVEGLPMRQLLVETDSPFLNPSKERNSPLNIPQIYAKIAEIKGLNSTEIEHIIYRNYQKFIS
jgi:TatD DNase family protein